MCRLLAYVGPPRPLPELLYEPPFSLEHQAYAPRCQAHGLVNADGWGVGWYDLALRPEPARYRTATPMWADRRFAEMAPLLRSGHVVAAVRSATPPAPVEESGTPPFCSGPYLFAHNGVVHGATEGAVEALRREVTLARAAQLQGSADSEVLFALALDRLDAGATLGEALAHVIARAEAVGGGRFNLMLSDGHRLAATACGDTLYVRTPSGAGGTVVASEPYDDAGGWIAVDDRTLVVVDGDGPTLTPFDPSLA